MLIEIDIEAVKATQKELLHAVVYGTKMVGCRKHPGNGLLLWSDGTLDCYKCGQEKGREDVVR